MEMSKRVIVNLATGPFIRGQERLTEKLSLMDEEYLIWRDQYPEGSPTEKEVPRAFKAYCMMEAAAKGYTSIMWCDASILPANSIEPIWQRIEERGYYIPENGYSNYEWTADSAYPDLFSEMDWHSGQKNHAVNLESARDFNRDIKHCVSGCWGVSLDTAVGRAILNAFTQLAKTKAFIGPVFNTRAHREMPDHGYSKGPCGPPDVSGHRHDQTALSVIAWRNGCELTDNPDWFAYKGSENERTIFIADGSYA